MPVRQFTCFLVCVSSGRISAGHIGSGEKNTKDLIWQTSQNIPIISKYSLGNPVLFQEPSGRTHLMYVALKGAYWNNAVLYSIYSEDEGETWSKPSLLWKDRGMMVRHPPVFLKMEHACYLHMMRAKEIQSYYRANRLILIGILATVLKARTSFNQFF